MKAETGMKAAARPTAPGLAAFLEKIDQLADSPDAVTRLRELVLTFAVTGRLLQGSYGHQAWPTATMADVSLQITDGEHATPQRTASGVPLATAKNVRDGFLDLTTTDYVAPTTAEKCWKRCKPRHDDLLMVCVGATTGRVCLVQDPPDMVLVRSVALIRPDPLRIAPTYLNIFLRSPGGQSQIWKNVKQSAQPCLYLGKMAGFEIALPPLAEQKRIVAKVDELMALCDRLETQLQESETRQAALARAALARFADAPTPANLELLFHDSFTITPADLRKTILTLAVQGHLVPQDPNDEPAEDSFGGLPTANEGSGNGEDLPPQWRCCTYRTLTTLVTSGSRGWKEYYSKSGAIFIRTQNIKTDRLILDDVAFVDLPKSAEGMRAQVLKDDIMITITGANVTKAARVVAKIPEAYVSQHIALTRPRWPEMSPWLHLCFVSPGAARGTLERQAYGDKPGLNLENIRDLVFPIPPLAEQHRIVAKVGQLAALVDQWESQIAATRTTADHLLSALVDRLTSQGAG